MSSKEDSSQASGSKNKLFTCSECSYSTRKKSNYTSHLLIHTGEKPFVCEMCDKGFSLKGDLVVHIRALHTGERPYKCDSCDYETADSSNLATRYPEGNTTPEGSTTLERHCRSFLPCRASLRIAEGSTT